MEKTLYTVTVFTENRVGLLSQISIIFTRRSLNIESLSVSPSTIPGVHKFTITVWSEKSIIEKAVTQIDKRIDVLKAFYYTDDELVFRKLHSTRCRQTSCSMKKNWNLSSATTTPAFLK